VTVVHVKAFSVVREKKAMRHYPQLSCVGVRYVLSSASTERRDFTQESEAMCRDIAHHTADSCRVESDGEPATRRAANKAATLWCALATSMR